MMKQSMLCLNLLLLGILGGLGSWPAEMAEASQGPLQPLPLSGYDFTDSGRDVFGQYDLTLYGDANTVCDLERGDVLQLEGAGFAMAEAAQFDFGDSISLCFWVKEGPNCPDDNLLVGQGWELSEASHTFSVRRLDEDAFEWYVSTDVARPMAAKHKNTDGSGDVSDGQWHHIAVTYDATDLSKGRKIYVDGQVTISSGSFGPVDTSYVGLSIGHLPPNIISHHSPFVGRIDDVGVFDTALTEEQIQRIALNGLSGYNPEQAVAVFPEDEAEVRQNRLILQWEAGSSSASHNVYLSKDREAVETFQPEAFLGNQTENEVEVAGLSWDTQYYWRVDEVNEAREGCPWFAPIWEFTTLGTLVIDDFESYTTGTPDRIFETWFDREWFTVDGQTVYWGNGTQMEVGEYFYLYDRHYDAEYFGWLGSFNTQYEGWFSMPLKYDNSLWPFYSETQRYFDPPMDWTTNGYNEMAHLSLQYQGTAMPASSIDWSDGKAIVTGAGRDLFETTDQCTFISMPMSGDFTMVVEVNDVEYTAEWARAGIMVREGLEAGARHVSAVVTPAKQAECLYRSVKGAKPRTTGDYVPFEEFNHWIRLTRQSYRFTAEHSTNGQDWQPLGQWVSLLLSDPVEVGLVVNSADSTTEVEGKEISSITLCRAVFHTVQINGEPVPAFEKLTDIGIEYNDPDHLYMAVTDAQGRKAILVHPDDPNALMREQWTEWRVPLLDLQTQGLDITQIAEMALGVGDTPEPGVPREPGGEGKFYVDLIRLMAEE